MISFPTSTHIWIVAGMIDLSRGFTGLSALVQTALELDPCAGHVFVFRGRRGDLIKVLWWDGDGLCLKRMRFGRKSEKLDRQIEQLELQLEDLEASPATSESPESAPTQQAPASERKSTRRPLPERLPRETKTHAPKQTACPGCGGKLSLLGEDVSEILEYVPAHFKVIRHVRPKLSCTCCDRIVQEPAPSRPIDRVMAGRPRQVRLQKLPSAVSTSIFSLPPA